MTKFSKIISTLSILFLSQVALADHLVIYAYPAPLGINWLSPNSLTWSTIANSLVKDKKLTAIHSIGHMNFDLNCDKSDFLPNGARIVAGQTSLGDESEQMILKKGYGLGAAITATPGRWETQEEIESDYKVRFRRGSISFIDFKISPKTCARVAQYLKEYLDKGLDQIYGGLHSRPRFKEGGGCSAFAISVMEIAGIMKEEFYTHWQHNKLLPENLIGGPITGNFVDIKKMLFAPESHQWGSSKENSYDLTFWDPYRVHRWIKSQAKKGNHNPIKIKKSFGLRMDAQNAPTPTDSLWLN